MDWSRTANNWKQTDTWWKPTKTGIQLKYKILIILTIKDYYSR